MDVEEAIEILRKIDIFWLTEKEACALSVCIQILEEYMKEGKNNEKLC